MGREKEAMSIGIFLDYFGYGAVDIGEGKISVVHEEQIEVNQYTLDLEGAKCILNDFAEEISYVFEEASLMAGMEDYDDETDRETVCEEALALAQKGEAADDFDRLEQLLEIMENVLEPEKIGLFLL